MPNREENEIVVRGPVFVPLSAVVAGGFVLVSLITAFAFIKFQLSAQAADISDLKGKTKDGLVERQQLQSDVRVIKTILTLKFPDAAAAAKNEGP